MEETLVPIFLFLVIGVVMGAWILTRHKERIAAIEKGVSSEEIKALFATRRWGQPSGHGSLKWGLVFIFVGAAVLLGMYFRQTYMVEESIYAALIALFGGLGLVEFYLIARKQAPSPLPRQGRGQEPRPLRILKEGTAPVSLGAAGGAWGPSPSHAPGSRAALPS